MTAKLNETNRTVSAEPTQGARWATGVRSADTVRAPDPEVLERAQRRRFIATPASPS